jgi:hypothetical protein
LGKLKAEMVSCELCVLIDDYGGGSEPGTQGDARERGSRRQAVVLAAEAGDCGWNAAVQYPGIVHFEQDSWRSDLTAEARWTQRGRNRTQKALTAEYAEYAERELLCRFAFRIFRGFCHRGYCSQAANNLDYCNTEKGVRLEISAAIASLRFGGFALTVHSRLKQPIQIHAHTD